MFDNKQIKQITKHFLNFLLQWKEEVDSGDVSDDVAEFGLCFNFTKYLADIDESCDAYEFLRIYMFNEDDTPFNSKKDISYYEETNQQTCHLNPKRVAWVDAKIKELENEFKTES